MDNDFLREQLINFLKGGQAHMTFDEIIKGFPMAHINDVFPHGEYTFWQLLEHIYRTQHDLLEFMTNSDYRELEWPKGYWPEKDKKAMPEDWEKTIQAYRHDLEELIALVENPHLDLSARVPQGTGQIYLREFLLAIDHASYELGEFGIIRQVLNIWEK